MRAPYSKFGETRLVRVTTCSQRNGYVDHPPKEKWDDTLWIERPEDEYALMSDWAKGRVIRLVSRQDWLNAKEDP